jgi:dolichol-phosphate mannosyltransferase
LLRYGLQGTLPPLVSPDTARDYIYVDDVIQAYVQLAGSTTSDPGAVYNVGTGTQTSLAEVVDVAKRVLRIDTAPEWGTMKRRSWDTAVWVADNSKIQQELGWRPCFDVEQGFRATVEWFSAASEAAHYETVWAGS